jgi:hypothetical protein
MRKNLIFTIILTFIISSLTACSNSYGDVSMYEARTYEGVFMQVEATAKNLTYSIYSQNIELYFGEFQEDMELEKWVKGEWHHIPQKDATYAGLGHGVSPGGWYDITIQWKTYYQANLNKGKYRLIFTFYVNDNFQDKYNVVSEFTIK